MSTTTASEDPKVVGQNRHPRPHAHHRREIFGVRQPLSKTADTAIGMLGIALVVVAWCVLTYGHFVKPLFLPTPTAM